MTTVPRKRVPKLSDPARRIGEGRSAGWNFADVWEHIADALPGAPALIDGNDRWSWSRFDQRADGIAATLLGAGLSEQSKVAQYLFNSSEYLQSFFGVLKAGLVPVNTSYRCTEDELLYVWENADVEAVIFHRSLLQRVVNVREQLPGIGLWICVGDDAGACPDWACGFEDAANCGQTRVVPSWGRSGDDVLLTYSGGTTGLPKGVIWRQSDLYNKFSEAVWRDPPLPDWDHVRARIFKPNRPIGLPASPLFHATGQFVALEQLCMAGAVVTLPGRTFDPVELLDTIERERVSVLGFVGDAFGIPMLQLLDEQPGRWDASSVNLCLSSGASLSARTKRGLLSHIPSMTIVDTLCATEALFMGSAVTTLEAETRNATFLPGKSTRVIGKDGLDVEPGSGEIGLIAAGGYQSIGYHKDPVLSAAKSVASGSHRYTLTGDYAYVNADGTINFVGRGSGCINTAGEKVFPEEVEQVLKLHPVIRDAVVVGIPDRYYGEMVVAMIQLEDNVAVIMKHVTAHIKSLVASYKTPRYIFPVKDLERLPNGKTDYTAHARHGDSLDQGSGSSVRSSRHGQSDWEHPLESASPNSGERPFPESASFAEQAK